MTLKNDPKSSWVNGSLGTVTELERDRVWMRLDSDDSIVDVGRLTWENVRYKWDQANKKVVTEVTGKKFSHLHHISRGRDTFPNGISLTLLLQRQITN